jgi:hypothetical protein
MPPRTRILSLRGVLDPVSAEIPLPPQKIFDFESAGSPDRAWKVLRFEIWPSDFGDGQGWTYQTFPSHKFTIYTDSGGNPAVLNADENRAIGWAFTTSQCGKDQSCLSPVHERWILDPDHLVTGRVFIGQEACTAIHDTTSYSTWSYLIELEARKVSSAESILQTLKGRGQDVAN